MQVSIFSLVHLMNWFSNKICLQANTFIIKKHNNYESLVEGKVKTNFDTTFWLWNQGVRDVFLMGEGMIFFYYLVWKYLKSYKYKDLYFELYCNFLFSVKMLIWTERYLMTSPNLQGYPFDCQAFKHIIFNRYKD